MANLPILGNITVDGTISKLDGTTLGFLKANGDVDLNNYSIVGHTHTFASVTSKPTTLTGYGITDLIGNRNLILNSPNFLFHGSDQGNSTGDIAEADYIKITFPNAGNIYTYITTSVDRVQGETYTLSLDVNSTAGYGLYFYPSENYTWSSGVPNTGGVWNRISITYTQTGITTTGATSILFGFNGALAGAILKYRNIKLEKGSKSTDWTPAPEDQVANWASTSGYSLIKNKPTTLSGYGITDASLNGHTHSSLYGPNFGSPNLNTLQAIGEFKAFSLLANSLNIFPAPNNINFAMSFDMYNGEYTGQLGFNNSGDIYSRVNNTPTWNKLWHSGNLTNLNQLTNGPGYMLRSYGALLDYNDATLQTGVYRTDGLTVNNTNGNGTLLTVKENGGFQLAVTDDSGSSLKFRNYSSYNGSGLWRNIWHDGNLVNPITGTGTTNYIPKFTGVGSLGNSLISENTVGIGIGTAGAVYSKLEIAYPTYVASNPMLSFKIEDGTYNPRAIISHVGAIGVPSFVKFDSAYSSGWGPTNWVFNSGNVGIGTTAPTAKLDVSGTSRFSENILMSGNKGINFSDANHGIVGDATLGVRIFTYGVTNGIFLQQVTGNVGIGTTTPSAKLDVIGSIFAGYSNQIQITPTDNASLYYHAADGTTFTIGTKTYNNPILFAVNSIEKMRIASNGHIGIGTTTPSEKLHVVGNGLFSGNVKTQGIFTKYNSYMQNPFLQVHDESGGVGSTLLFEMYRSKEGIVNSLDIVSTLSDVNLWAANTKILNVRANGATVLGTLSASNLSGTNTGDQTLAGLGGAPSSGSANYIQNQNTAAQSGNMWISGNSIFKDTELRPIASDGVSTFKIGTYLDGNYGSYIKTDFNYSYTVNTNLRFGVSNGGILLDALSLNYNGAATFASTVTASNGQLIGGTGTANYIPKFTGAGSLGNSQIFDNGTNVGIGTTMPNTILNIQSVSPKIRLSHNVQNEGEVGIEFSHSTYAGQSEIKTAIVTTPNGGYGRADLKFILNDVASTIGYSSITDTKVIIKNNGNVGIGTTTPQAKLHVEGADDLFNLKMTSGGFNAITLSTTFAGGNNYAINPYIPGVSNNGFEIRDITNNVSRIAIASPTGNVGIGTTTPTKKLDVNGDGWFGVGGSTIGDVTGTVSIGGDIQRNIDGRYTTAIKSINTNSNPELLDPRMGLFTQGAGTFLPTGLVERVSILANNGNVGIGTILPNAKFNIKGGLALALNGTVAVTALSTTVTGTTTTFNSQLSVGDAIKIGTEIFTVATIPSATSLTLDTAYQGATTTGLTAYSDGNLFAIDNGKGTNKVTVTKSGNVGIGTATPTAKLDVNGTIKAAGGTMSSSLLFNASNGNMLSFKYDTSPEIQLYQNSTEWGFYNTITAKSDFIINNLTGNVGIGTTTPSDNLSVSKSGGASISIGTGEGAGSNAIPFYTDLNFRGAFNTTKARIRSWDAGSNSSLSPLAFYTYGNDGTALAERLRIEGNGNVGIGTTTPTAKLEVNGEIYSNNSTTGTLYLGKTLLGTNYKAAAIIGTPSSTYNAVGRLSFQLPTHGVGTDYGLTEQMYLEVVASDSKMGKMVILPNGGNVGIGTTTPTEKLEVVGNIKAIAAAPFFELKTTQTGTPSWKLYNSYSTVGDFTISGAVANAFKILPNGNTLIGTITDYGSKLVVGGSARIVGGIVVEGATATYSTMTVASGLAVGNLMSPYGNLLGNNQYIILGDGATGFKRTGAGTLQTYVNDVLVRTDASTGSVSALPITASSFIKSGGLATQFLKADGSTDSNSYISSASPTFSGIPAAPTADLGTNTTQLATTAFVAAADTGNVKISTAQEITGHKTFHGISNQSTYSFNLDNLGKFKTAGFSGVLGLDSTTGTISINTSTVSGLPGETPFYYTSPIRIKNNGVAFSDIPTAPTASLGTNNTQLATTAFVINNASARPYKVYTAMISHSGIAGEIPTAIVLENTLGGTVVWSYFGIGQYIGTLAGVFTGGKTIVIVNRPNPPTLTFDVNVAGNVVNGTNGIAYTTFNNTGYIDGASNIIVEARVYN